MELRQRIESTAIPPTVVVEKTGAIHTKLQAASRSIDAANFNLIHSSNWEILFYEYDRAFFEGRARAVREHAVVFFPSRNEWPVRGKDDVPYPAAGSQSTATIFLTRPV